MANFDDTKDYTFKKLCKMFDRFDIPNFQRPYSWKNKQLQEFFNSIIENDAEYFIGNVVVVKDVPLKIIDGQQRMTTIFLLLVVVRDLYLEISPQNEQEKEIIKQKIELIKSYLFYRDLEELSSPVYKRLNLGKSSYQKIFELIVDGCVEKIDSRVIGGNEKRIINNYNILKKLVSGYVLNSRLDKLEQILTKILSLQVILIVCRDNNDVYRIFEGFNSTGLGLSVADLVKNSVLMESSGNVDIQNGVETSWLEMEDLFESSDINKFPRYLRHQWISENGYVLMSNLFSDIRDLKIKNKTANDILKYVNNLENEAKIYLGMIYEKFEKFLDVDKDLLSSFQKFRLLRNEQVYEILLSYFRLYKSGKVRKSTLQKYLNKLWIFVLRSRFISINPSDYEKIFAKYCENLIKIDNPDKFSNVSDSFISQLKQYVSDDSQFVLNFVLDVSYGSDNKLIKEVLLEIMSLKNKNIAIKNPEIEHILPQEPNKWGLTKTDIRESVNKIGNLTLLFEGDNKDAKDEVIDYKINIYNNTNFSFNKEIGNKWAPVFKENWEKAIEERSRDIANTISKIWKL